MLDNGALAVSIPATELASFRPPGSVFTIDDLPIARLSSPLALAVDLVMAVCQGAGFAPTFVARPEIFTHGESRAWLVGKLRGAKDHLALSDGSTIRMVPGLRNHVFLFGLGRAADASALARLEKRAPELFGSLHTQINTARQFAAGKETPTPVAISGLDVMEQEAAQIFRIAINVDSADDSVARTLRSPAPAPTQKFSELEYVALTETSLADASFQKMLAAKLNLVYFDPLRALVLRLPPSVGASRALETRLRAVFAALNAARPRAPIVPTASALITTCDLSGERLAAFAEASDFTAPDTFDFWRHSPETYAQFRTLRVHARSRLWHRAAFNVIVEAIAGRPIEIVWLDSQDEHSPY